MGKRYGTELSVSEFAAIMGMSRQTLIYYDRIGLFPPARIDPDTGYRYYDRRQIGRMSFIQTLAGLGVPLAEIREEVSEIRPDRMEGLLRRQRASIRKEIERLRRSEAMVSFRLEQLRQSRDEEPGTVVLIHEDEPAPLFVSGPLPCGKDPLPDRVIVDFYAEAERRGIPFGYPMGCIVSGEDIAAGRTDRVSRLLLPLGSDDGANACRPAGDYLVLRERTDCGGTPAAYTRLLDEAAARGLRPAGDAVEEYELDEVTCADPADFLCRIALPVEA